MKFRYDINGLRAIAVLVVLFFHLGISGFSGGYVGVDIFFVISGFLMTGIISTKLNTGNFGFLDFYAARAKRIIPALVVLVAALLILGFFYLIPFDYKSLGNDSISALGFYSNIAFAHSDGYFDVTSQNNWLLHTWSLSVEWQFYLLFPIFLAWLKKKAFFNKGLVVTFVLSLFLSIVLTKLEPTAAFFILPTRVWEFLAGGFVFLYSDKIPKFKFRLWVGLLLIAISTFIYTDNLNFPSYWAIVPVLGAILVIAENTNHVVLKNAFIQYVGKISYSLYLWHWPIVVAIKYLEIESNVLNITVAIALAFALAHISYVFVEQAFRNVKKNVTSLKIIAINLLVVSLICSYVGVVSYKEGFKFRVSDAVLAMETHEYNKIYNIEGCGFNYKKQSGLPDCKVGNKTAKSTVAIWGDSHASYATQGINKVLLKRNKAAYLYSYAGCPSVLDAHYPGARGNFFGMHLPENNRSIKCRLINQRTYDFISNSDEIKKVILVSRWPVYAYGETTTNSPHLYAVFGDVEARLDNLEERLEYYTNNIVKTACGLSDAGKQVYLFTAVPEMAESINLTLAKYLLLHGKIRDISIPVSEYNERNKAFIEAFGEAEKKCNIKVVNIKPYFCDDEKCSGVKDGKPLYADDDHISRFGNEMLRPAYEGTLK